MKKQKILISFLDSYKNLLIHEIINLAKIRKLEVYPEVPQLATINAPEKYDHLTQIDASQHESAF